MNKINIENLTSYEQLTAIRLNEALENLMSGGITKEAAIKRIIRDVKRVGLDIKPSFIKLVLK